MKIGKTQKVNPDQVHRHEVNLKIRLLRGRHPRRPRIVSVVVTRLSPSFLMVLAQLIQICPHLRPLVVQILINSLKEVTAVIIITIMLLTIEMWLKKAIGKIALRSVFKNLVKWLIDF